MSQHDFNIANQGFPSFRSDLNDGLEALATNSAGSTAPSTTYAYQFWYDTANDLLKMRNGDNDAWITLAAFDQATDEWEIRSAVVQAVDSAGLELKTDDGTTRIDIADNGDVSIDSGTLFVDASNNNVLVGTTVRTDYRNEFPALQNHGPGFSGSVAAVNSTDVDSLCGFIAIKEYSSGAVPNNFTLGNLIFAGADGSGTNFGAAGISARVDGSSGTGNLPGRLEFGTTPPGSTSTSEAMRINSEGDVLIGTTTKGNTHAYFERQANSRSALHLGTSTTSGASVAVFQNANGFVGSIVTSGSSTIYNTSSDYRLKENVVDIADGIDRLKQIPVYRFNFIADPDTVVDGFLAHEVQAYVPEAITGEKDEMEAIGDLTDAEGAVVKEGVTEPEEISEGQTWTQTGERPVYQGIDQSKLVPLLTAALQEAVEKIQALEARIETLETK